MFWRIWLYLNLFNNSDDFWISWFCPKWRATKTFQIAPFEVKFIGALKRIVPLPTTQKALHTAILKTYTKIFPSVLKRKKTKVFIFLMTACADTFLSVCRLNDGIQFYCDRVSVPFLKDKREALVDSFLCYLECDIREFRNVKEWIRCCCYVATSS